MIKYCDLSKFFENCWKFPGCFPIQFILEKKIHLLQASYISLYHLSAIYHHGCIKSSLSIMLLNLLHPYHYFCPLGLSISERGDCGTLITLMALNNGLQVTGHLAYDFVAPTIKRWTLFTQVLRLASCFAKANGTKQKYICLHCTRITDVLYSVLLLSLWNLYHARQTGPG